MFQGWQKCIRDHPLTPGGRGGNRGSLGVSKSNFIKSKSFANKSCQVCFKGDKNSFRVTFWPLGAPGGGLGVSKSNFIKSKSFGNKSCQVCFRGDKKSFGVTFWPLRVQAHLGRPLGGQKISSNQKISLTKVVGYVSGVTKTSQAPARLGPKQLCVST